MDLDREFTEKELQEYIKDRCPGISYKDMWEIRCNFVCKNWSLNGMIFLYNRKIQVEEWNKRKDKCYYRVRMLNGGEKVVFMCEEMVRDFYKDKIIEKIG